MRIVFDTNVLISAFISRGVCTELFEHCIVNHSLISSHFIIQKFQKNLKKKFDCSATEISQMTHLLLSKFLIVKPEKFAVSISRDPDDDIILATAITGQCQCIITGDKDLLVLKGYQGISILKPKQFWNYEQHQVN